MVSRSLTRLSPLAPRPLLPILALILAACAEGRSEQKDVAANAPAATPDTSDERVKRADLARITGDTNATVWIVEIGDFQCPACRMWHDSTYAKVKKEFVETGKVRMAFINFPLRQHRNAVPASEGAMCAGAQGRFWEFHDRVYDTQEQWSGLADGVPFFERIATELKLDLDAYRKCVSDHVMVPMIQADYQRGVEANVRSTPSFFVGGQLLQGAHPIESFRQALGTAGAVKPEQ
jgi:protein-disulfide isomerase